MGREVANDTELPLAVVPLGFQPARPHQIRWNITVNRKRLGAGSYEVLLEIPDETIALSGKMVARGTFDYAQSSCTSTP